MNDIDFGLVAKLIVRYMIESIAIALAVFWVPTLATRGFYVPAMDTVLVVAITGAMTMAILDFYSQPTAGAFRKGIGFGSGLKYVNSYPGASSISAATVVDPSLL